MIDHRFLKVVLYGYLGRSKYSKGGHYNYFKGTLKTSFKTLNINHDIWKKAALDRLDGVRLLTACETNEITAAKHGR